MKAERSAIVGKLLAQMMVMSGFTQIITMDLHQKELQGFFDCPVDNLRASPFFINYIQQKVSLLKVESRAQPDWAYEVPDQTGLDTQICGTGPAGPEQIWTYILNILHTISYNFIEIHQIETSSL